MTEDAAFPHIEITPGVCGGKPRIVGHRIRVQDIYEWHELVGMSADAIASQFNLTLGQVYAGLAYYFDHREEIQAQMRADEEFVERMKRELSAAPRDA